MMLLLRAATPPYYAFIFREATNDAHAALLAGLCARMRRGYAYARCARFMRHARSRRALYAPAPRQRRAKMMRRARFI